MRSGRILTLAAVIIALASPAPAEAAQLPRKQMAGLQIALVHHGLYRGPIDAIKGPQTTRAVVVFQRRHGLAQDGIAGPRTRKALGRLGRPLYGQRQLRRGMVGWDVSVLQYLLVRSGSPCSIDGAFGRQTRAAVMRFQARRGLAADGVVGPQTRRALAAAAPERVRKRLNHWARRYGVSPPLVRALAWVESGHQPHVVSSAGARGVMQVLPGTRRYVERVLIGRRLPPTIDGNIRAGVAYLDRQIHTFHPRLRRSVGAYYQGPSAMRRHGPYGETRRYVRAVMSLRRAM